MNEANHILSTTVINTSILPLSQHKCHHPFHLRRDDGLPLDDRRVVTIINSLFCCCSFWYSSCGRSWSGVVGRAGSISCPNDSKNINCVKNILDSTYRNFLHDFQYSQIKWPWKVSTETGFVPVTLKHYSYPIQRDSNMSIIRLPYRYLVVPGTVSTHVGNNFEPVQVYGTWYMSLNMDKNIIIYS